MSQNPAVIQKPKFGSFSAFWQHYLLQHQQPLNQALHVVGTLAGLVCIGLGITRSWMWFAAVIPMGYGPAWLGHYLFEQNRPLTFRYPLWSLLADYRLVAQILMGSGRPAKQDH